MFTPDAIADPTPPPASETRRAGPLALSFAAGSADVLGLLGVGGVFTSGVTGNMVHFVIAVDRSQWLAASHASGAILAFACGVMLAKRLNGSLTRLLMLELACLSMAAAVAGAVHSPPRAVEQYLLFGLFAFGMGIQARIAVAGNYGGMATSLFTMNLVRVVCAPSENPLRLCALTAFLVGGASSALMLRTEPVAADWLPATAVLIALALALPPPSRIRMHQRSKSAIAERTSNA